MTNYPGLVTVAKGQLMGIPIGAGTLEEIVARSLRAVDGEGARVKFGLHEANHVHPVPESKKKSTLPPGPGTPLYCSFSRPFSEFATT